MIWHTAAVSIKKVKLITTVEHAGKRVDQVLADELPEALGRPVSKAKVRKLIMAGAVYLNRRPLRVASKDLGPGATLEAHVDLTKLFKDATSGDRDFELSADRILFEDDDLLVIDKPAGLPAQPTLDETRDSLFAAVNRFMSARDKREPYVGVHQRLDRDTSGVVLFTKSTRVNRAVAKIFSEHKAVKIYHAITALPGEWRRRSTLEREWTIKNRLGKVSSQSKRARFGAVRSGGDVAETSFRVIAEYPHGLLIEAIPKTGRKHQIRVHLSEYGLPILGDDLYGVEEHGRSGGMAPRLMLHASQLSFPHPTTGQEISVKSPMPRDFKECLRRIQTPRVG